MKLRTPTQTKANGVDRVATEVLRNAQRETQLASLEGADDVANAERSKQVHAVLLEVMSGMPIRERGLRARSA
jgi:hypothetical protein